MLLSVKTPAPESRGSAGGVNDLSQA